MAVSMVALTTLVRHTAAITRETLPFVGFVGQTAIRLLTPQETQVLAVGPQLREKNTHRAPYCMMQRDQVYLLALKVDPYGQVGSWAPRNRHSLLVCRAGTLVLPRARIISGFLSSQPSASRHNHRPAGVPHKSTQEHQARSVARLEQVNAERQMEALTQAQRLSCGHGSMTWVPVRKRQDSRRVHTF
jgi:hypothetical protein